MRGPYFTWRRAMRRANALARSTGRRQRIRRIEWPVGSFSELRVKVWIVHEVNS